MSWFIDNAGFWYFVIGMIGLGFGTAYWMQRRPKLLLGVAVAVGLIALLWLLGRMVVTDRQQIHNNVLAMADAVVAGKGDVLLKYFAGDFDFQGRKRQEVANSVASAAKQHAVTDIVIAAYDVEELKERTAKVYFRAIVHLAGEIKPIACRASFAKENEQWRLRQVEFYNPVRDEKIHIPLP